MNDDGDAVACESHVELKAVRAISQGAFEGCERVFGGDCGRAAMTDDERGV
jgi:hypothetical protein